MFGRFPQISAGFQIREAIYDFQVLLIVRELVDLRDEKDANRAFFGPAGGDPIWKPMFRPLSHFLVFGKTSPEIMRQKAVF